MDISGKGGGGKSIIENSGLHYHIINHPEIAYFRLSSDLSEVIECNDVFPGILECSKSELSRVYSINVWADPMIFKKCLKSPSRDNEGSTFETVVITINGKRKTLSVACHCCYDCTNQPFIEGCAVVIALDDRRSSNLEDSVNFIDALTNISINVEYTNTIDIRFQIRELLSELVHKTTAEIAFVYESGNNGAILHKKYEYKRPSESYNIRLPSSMNIPEVNFESNYSEECSMNKSRNSTGFKSPRINWIIGVGSRRKAIFQNIEVDYLLKLAAIVYLNVLHKIELLELLSKSEAMLEKKTNELYKKDIALQELLAGLDSKEQKLKAEIQQNIDRLVLPQISSLREEPGLNNNIGLSSIEEILQNISSTFLGRIESLFEKLTPREIEVCELLKKGYTTKMIANQMNLSTSTINKHRERIRNKLNLRNTGQNLTTYLQSL